MIERRFGKLVDLYYATPDGIKMTLRPYEKSYGEKIERLLERLK